MRFFPSLAATFALLLSSAGPAHAAVLNDTTSADLSSSFAVQSTTAVPGDTLKPGTYSIAVVDHLSDRIILRIVDAKGKVKTTFLGVANPAIKSNAGGPIAWSSDAGHRSTLRGFTFPGGSTVEFVYPKTEAVSIAKVNAAQVPAIDPASDSGKLANKKLSPQDLQVVTLWSLQATRIGPNEKTRAIEAQHYQPAAQLASAAPAPSQNVPAANTQVAMNQPPSLMPSSSRQNATASPRLVRTAASRPRAAQTSQSSDAQPQQDAQGTNGTREQRLPQTASALPLLELAGFLALVSAFLLRMRRTTQRVR